MEKISNLLKSEFYKKEIAKYVYQRLYTRFLKVFDFEDELVGTNGNLKEKYKEQYKNGFVLMASCSLLIETLAGFLSGNNETPKGKSTDMFKKVFEKAEDYNNNLKIFKDEPFYGTVRCGLLHQGETKGPFKIRRRGQLLEDNIINATKFFGEVKDFLEKYKEELEREKWESEIWDACRMKIRHIVKNSE